MRLFELYTKPNAMIRNYFRYLDNGGHEEAFDPQRHYDDLERWFDFSFDNEEGYELNGPADWYKLPEEVQEEFLAWFDEERDPDEDDGGTAQHFMLLKKQLLPRTTWLVHFCDDPDGIRRQGFTKGTMDVEKLGLTTYTRKTGPGYNFAFLATSDDAATAESDEKYGRHAVLFQSSGVLAHHHNDEEDQVVFFGPDVPRQSIIPLYRSREDDEWYVYDRRTDRRLVSGAFEKVVAWVIQHGRQYQAAL